MKRKYFTNCGDGCGDDSCMTSPESCLPLSVVPVFLVVECHQTGTVPVRLSLVPIFPPSVPEAAWPCRNLAY